MSDFNTQKEWTDKLHAEPQNLKEAAAVAAAVVKEKAEKLQEVVDKKKH
jgi:hypothetical protein